jgi:hypothetical protein
MTGPYPDASLTTQTVIVFLWRSLLTKFMAVLRERRYL